jgi:hypothetical protein
MSTIRIASFDMGKKNFAFCIEEFTLSEVSELKKINMPLKQRYKENGLATPKMEELLEKIFSNGKLVLYKNLDLTRNGDNNHEIFNTMNDEMDKYTFFWDSCACFVIEEQMCFGKKVNKMALKLGQHCYSYFTFKYGRFKKVVEFPAYHKTQVLGAPKIEHKTKAGKIKFKAMEKKDRKKWSVNKAIEILTSRGEIDFLDTLTSVKKKDDLADVLTQLQAFKYKAFVEQIY